MNISHFKIYGELRNLVRGVEPADHRRFGRTNRDPFWHLTLIVRFLVGDLWKRLVVLASLGLLVGCSDRSVPFATFPPSGPPEPPSQLSLLLKTNVLMTAALVPYWVGESKHTFQYGLSTNQEPSKAQDELHLLFDRFMYPGIPHGLEEKPRAIARSAGGKSFHGDVHAYLPKLPADELIISTKTLAALTNILGRFYPGIDAWGSDDGRHSSATWYFFTLKDTGLIETLSVFCLTVAREDEHDPRIEGLRITRGSAKPVQPLPKPAGP